MKAIKCELCGSNDIIKQDGIFVCQHCGTKYSAEEAKKLIVDGKVVIDNTTEKENLLTLARRAKEEGNAVNLEKYYGKLLELDPDNWEASFYSVLGRQMQCRIYQIASAADTICGTLKTTFALINRTLSITEKRTAYLDNMK